MGVFDDIIAAGQKVATQPGVANFFQGIGNRANEWWLRNVKAPQSGDSVATTQFFQYRKTGNPGAVQPLGQNLGTQGGSPPEAIDWALTHGPKTDLETIRGMLALRDMWAKREQQYPGEGMMYIDPRAANDPGVFRHEAAHSLFDQIVSDPKIDSRLADMAKSSGMYIVSSAPKYDATEALAFETGWPSNLPAQYKGPEGPAYVQAVAGSAQTPDQKRAAGRLLNLYNNSGSALAK